ncbi:hypothetical protein [uncultured Thiodictyon sp.]|uniref:DinB/UmuC family translesion DNA polymerase n=1 Tax=uncultured Thiodictyon sp. TaxID=1846217 RepID=UPI0025DF8E34|nr:hypothetical protein [uncultured Thiodictyon sp.]
MAKIASDFGKPDGLVVVPPERILDFLGGQPVGVLRGVGSRTRPILKRLGLRTVADLRGLSLTQLQAHLGSRAATNLYQQARGIASDRVGERAVRQSLSKETTFGVDVTDPGVLRDTLRGLAVEIAAAAREETIAGRTVTLKIRFCGFETHTRQRRLPRRSDDARTLFAAAWSLFEAGRWQGKPVRLIGLGIADLGTPGPVQPDLFDGAAERPADSERERRLTVTVDRIHARFGAGALHRGLSVTDPVDPAHGLGETPAGRK